MSSVPADVSAGKDSAGKDPIQYKISVTQEDRLLWRSVLNYRYYEDLGSLDTMSVDWSDLNPSSKVITIDS